MAFNHSLITYRNIDVLWMMCHVVRGQSFEEELWGRRPKKKKRNFDWDRTHASVAPACIQADPTGLDKRAVDIEVVHQRSLNRSHCFLIFWWGGGAVDL